MALSNVFIAALGSLGFAALFKGIIAVLWAIWYALLQQLWVMIWAHDFVIYHWHRNGLRIGLACGCWLLLALHRRPRFWALLPFRYIWRIFFFLNISLWSCSVRCPVDKEVGHLLPEIFLFPRAIEIPDDSPAHIDEGPVKDFEATEPPKKVYKGPIVRSLKNKNGLVNSAPIIKRSN
jgi:hypothetical protein